MLRPCWVSQSLGSSIDRSWRIRILILKNLASNHSTALLTFIFEIAEERRVHATWDEGAHNTYQTRLKFVQSSLKKTDPVYIYVYNTSRLPRQWKCYHWNATWLSPTREKCERRLLYVSSLFAAHCTYNAYTSPLSLSCDHLCLRLYCTHSLQ